MKNIPLFLVLMLFGLFSVLIAEDEGVGLSLSVPPEIADEFKLLFQSGKFAEAEVLYLKACKTPNANWLTLLKMKQGKVKEGMEHLKKEIDKTTSLEEKKIATKKALWLISDVSPELGIKFLNDVGEDIKTDIEVVCFLARYYMFRGEFDKAESLVMAVLSRTSQLEGKKLANAENAMGMMVAELYVQGYIKEALKFFAILEEKYPKFRLDPGRQLLWSRIAARDDRGMEALKKIDWVIETFPDYCKKKSRCSTFG